MSYSLSDSDPISRLSVIFTTGLIKNIQRKESEDMLKPLIQLKQLISQKIRIINALVLLGTALPLWLTTEAIAPQIVQAYTARVNLNVDTLPQEGYRTLIQRAETAARAAAQRSFDQDILVTDVSVIVSVENLGAVAPVLELNVSRPQWRNHPDPQRWAIYFKASHDLLFPGNTTAATAKK